MSIKNLFGRGVGFGAVHWITTHGYSSGVPSVITYVFPPGVILNVVLSACVADPMDRPTIANPMDFPTVTSP